MPLKAISKAATNCWASLAGLSRSEDIQIHVPFLAHSPQEVLARWYHEGLNAFESNLEGGNELLGQFGRAVHDLALEFPVTDRAAAEQELADFLKKTAAARRAIRRLLEQGRDRLLELNRSEEHTSELQSLRHLVCR